LRKGHVVAGLGGALQMKELAAALQTIVLGANSVAVVKAALP
jgi:hypothetical protein